MKKIFLALVLILSSGMIGNAQDKKMDDFISNLMNKMTLQEKIGQLNLQPAADINTGSPMAVKLQDLVCSGKLGAILNLPDKNKIMPLQKLAVEKSRLHIPLLVGLDVIHGYETIFPIPLGQSCSWDLDGIENGIRISAEEAGYDGLSWTYSPMVDIAKDARWGRIAEGNGEDPYLGSLIARALVRGFQGDGSYKDRGTLMACLKHYALYGASESGLDYNYVDMSRLRMYNDYFPPYKAAVEEGVGSVMSSFNMVDGQAATANKWLLDDVLRKQWGFKGFLVTDYASIMEMTKLGFGNLKENSVKALKAGTDMDMCSVGFLNTLEESIKEGKVSMAYIDQACRRVLEAKYKLGLFKDPYRNCGVSDKERAAHTHTPQMVKTSRDFAAETFVLLKNENHLLPLKKQGKIALIGPNSDNQDALLGTWAVHRPAREGYRTLKQSMEMALNGTGAEVLCCQGCDIASGRFLQAARAYHPEFYPVLEDTVKARKEALEIAKKADVIVFAGGEGADCSGESHSRVTLEMPEVQLNLLKDLAKMGKPIVLLNFAGRPTVMNWEKENVPAILNVWFPGTEGGDAICDVLFGDKVPCGHLTTSMPQAVGQEPFYYNRTSSSRPVANGTVKFKNYSQNYFEIPNGPAFPFGYGLSYTTFKYGEMNVARSGHNITVTVPVSNTGDYDGVEVVQCYIHDIAASIARPMKELKGFQRVFLKKGETKQVSISLDEKSLSFFDAEGNVLFEPGEFDIMVGSNCDDVQTKKVMVE